MFERLTRIDAGGIITGAKRGRGEYVGTQEMLERLYEYENSNLSPEEVQSLAQAKADGRLVVLPETGIGDLSDGYHTFNELYHHRAILFSVICNEHPDISWKSKLHHDGTMFDGMFIVGINTPEGQATYHYDINPYWDMFRVRELEKAPEWDGHTSEQAIERIAGLTREAAEKTLGGRGMNECKYYPYPEWNRGVNMTVIGNRWDNPELRAKCTRVIIDEPAGVEALEEIIKAKIDQITREIFIFENKDAYPTYEAAEKAIPTCNVTKLPCAGCNPCCEHREE